MSNADETLDHTQLRRIAAVDVKAARNLGR
jgi:hypothetical protein